MIERLQKLPRHLKILAGAAAPSVGLPFAPGVGAMAALVLGPGPDPSAGGSGGVGGAERQREVDSPEGNQPQEASRDEGAPDRLSEAEYVGTVGDIQAEAVEAFLDSHDKLLR